MTAISRANSDVVASTAADSGNGAGLVRPLPGIPTGGGVTDLEPGKRLVRPDCRGADCVAAAAAVELLATAATSAADRPGLCVLVVLGAAGAAAAGVAACRAAAVLDALDMRT